MAERRMFAKTIIDSDSFIDLPLTSQALYFHLSMRADDDGFINNPKKIQRMVGASDDDLKLLIAKRYILPFESGVIAIKHWRIHNYIRNDRYKETIYLEEKNTLQIKENGVYTERLSLGIPTGIPDVNHLVYQMDTQVSIGKDSIELGKDSIGKVSIDKDSVGKIGYVVPTLDEAKAYAKSEGYEIDTDNWYAYWNSKGWQDEIGRKVKDWKVLMRWAVKKGGNYGVTNKRDERLEQRWPTIQYSVDGTQM